MSGTEKVLKLRGVGYSRKLHCMSVSEKRDQSRRSDQRRGSAGIPTGIASTVESAQERTGRNKVADAMLRLHEGQGRGSM